VEGDRGCLRVISVVALSRYVPRSAHPRAETMTVGWLLELLRPALADLDNFLEAVGFPRGIATGAATGRLGRQR
jgi:hypothetical protein